MLLHTRLSIVMTRDGLIWIYCQNFIAQCTDDICILCATMDKTIQTPCVPPAG